MGKKYKYVEIQLHPYPYSVYVFTDKSQYVAYCKDHDLFKNPLKAIREMHENAGQAIDTSNNKSIYEHVCVLLPKIGELSDFDFEETIDHEVIHCVFRILNLVGSKVGMDYEYHEHFAYHVNYLDREIKTKVYKLVDKKQKVK